MFEVLLVMTRSYDELKKNIVTYVHAQVNYPTKLGCSILKRFLDLVETRFFVSRQKKNKRKSSMKKTFVFLEHFPIVYYCWSS